MGTTRPGTGARHLGGCDVALGILEPDLLCGSCPNCWRGWILLGTTGAATELIPSPARPRVIASLLSIPALPLVHGQVAAYDIRFGYGDYSYVCESDLKQPPQDKQDKTHAVMKDELRLIGKAGDLFFFVDSGKPLTVRVLKYDNFLQFRLNTHTTPPNRYQRFLYAA
jgi:hypothetical protein